MIPEIGKIYVKRTSNLSHVRKVVDVNDQKVHYELLRANEVLTRKRRTEFSCSLSTWRRWVKRGIEIVPETDDYSIYDGCKVYKNYLVLRVNGEPLMQCVEPTLRRYIKKEMVKHIGNDVYQLIDDTLEKRFHEIYGENLSPFFLEEKNSKCVVCGVRHGLSRHHVVPQRYIDRIDSKIKVYMSNILFICTKCHAEYEIHSQLLDSDATFDVTNPRKWMDHFVETMQPKFLSPNWNVQII